MTASIYQQPHRQGQLAVRLMADNLTGRVPFPPTIHLSPGVVMSSNLHLFREIRLAGVKFDDSALGAATRARAGSKFHLRGKTEADRLNPPNQDFLLPSPSNIRAFLLSRESTSLSAFELRISRDLRFFLTNSAQRR